MHFPLFKPFTIVAAIAIALTACQSAIPSTVAQPAAAPVMKIMAPIAGTTLAGPKVKVEIEVNNWTLTAANQTPKDGEGHLHFFVDVPADAVKVGEGIPLDQTAKFIHAGKAPYTTREIELSPGPHTLTVVMGDSVHRVLDTPAPVSIMFTVQ